MNITITCTAVERCDREPKDTTKNKWRKARALTALEASKPDTDNDTDTNIQDLICDLLHAVSKEGNPLHVLARAIYNYRVEVNDTHDQLLVL